MPRASLSCASISSRDDFYNLSWAAISRYRNFFLSRSKQFFHLISRDAISWRGTATAIERRRDYCSFCNTFLPQLRRLKFLAQKNDGNTLTNSYILIHITISRLRRHTSRAADIITSRLMMPRQYMPFIFACFHAHRISSGTPPPTTYVPRHLMRDELSARLDTWVEEDKLSSAGRTKTPKVHLSRMPIASTRVAAGRHFSASSRAIGFATARRRTTQEASSANTGKQLSREPMICGPRREEEARQMMLPLPLRGSRPSLSRRQAAQQFRPRASAHARHAHTRRPCASG